MIIFNYYKVSFKNMSTNGIESCILPLPAGKVDNYAIESALESYLWAQCYCDSYEFKSYRLLSAKQAIFFEDMLYNFIETANIDIESDDILKTNALYYCNSTFQNALTYSRGAKYPEWYIKSFTKKRGDLYD